ncbi:up-regulator of cell proliferation-like [Toxotes jaculatrix]|uniref:up-regulator of cell proliferation-like n=1 Tax=Toxotes jaculatrix TaxID=941984 RepID=UPI001B3AC2EA|nr:up-regulator of cell proliferation-like [Toxotes jaculatrix]
MLQKMNEEKIQTTSTMEPRTSAAGSKEQANEEKSQTSLTVDTKEQEPAALLNFLSKLGLEKFYPNKLTLQFILEINKNSINEEPVSSVEEIPWSFLRKLFKVNAKCRSCTQLSNTIEENDYLFELDLNTADDSEEYNKVNPLDLIVALFLCADSFLQQEMALKMSMCQFSLPLLLPPGNKSQCTLMLWALRDIVKEWCPHGLSESRGFVEDNIVQANIPFYSFVRLKNCSLSKSQLLNHVLSPGQQNRSIFIHRDVEGGAVKRKVANGLVEVCWHLPCGTENLDIFPKPVAFVNLRGDICESLTQFNFLFQVSTATFVFLDKVEENEHRILTSLQDVKSKLFLLVNRKEGNSRENMTSVKTLLDELDLPNSCVKSKDSRVNVAEFSKKVCTVIKTLLTAETTNIENMVDKAVELGFSVDECKGNDQKKAAEEFLNEIGEQPITGYKKQQLPLQGENWKRLSQLDMEECRLKKAGSLELEENKSQLGEEKQKIRNELSEGESTAMKTFIEHLSKHDKEKRDFFLKWMKLKLNGHSRNKLSELRNRFKEQCKKKDAKLIAELDQALLDSSLGIEHYMREMGLIYEFSRASSAKTVDELSRLPGLAAEMLLDGYPLELLDGDASNIPERWVTDVLMELHKKVGEKSRLLVLTVLGVQSTGKSTLLNTMFGVQFPVSSGRCTRGAFMLFLKVGADIQSDLNLDFIVLIDTEGLKSPDLAQLEDSYEHDNQLATFVIGLSDVTIINIAMENLTEMKDVLQIAVYALLRMKRTDKKPVCHFVGLWHGTPPMAPVNTGYSEAVADFKKNLLDTIFWKSDRRTEASQIPEFLEWMRNLWKAVKNEDFVFSFRNSLVAHALNQLCKDFSQWEWEFRKVILSWQTEAELEILIVSKESDIHTWNSLVTSKKSDGLEKVEAQERKIKEKLNDYYRRQDRDVNLIEPYIKDIFQSINNLADEIKQSLINKLDFLSKSHSDVMTLLKDCTPCTALSDEQLTEKFEKIWTGVINQDTHDLESLQGTGDVSFEVKRKHQLGSKEDQKTDLERLAERINESCTQFVLDKAKTNTDYNDGFTEELLGKIDKSLQENCKCWQDKFETDLKLHICGTASREFLKMYKNNKKSDYLDQYKQREHCQGKANDFVRVCIKPAVEDYISKSLGEDIVNEILTSCPCTGYSSFFQYNIQKEMLQKENFKSFAKYICNYEVYVKDWIFQHIVRQMSQDKTLCKLKNKNLQVIVHNVTEALKEATKEKDGTLLPDNKESITKLISNLRQHLTKDISISVEAEKTTLFQIKSTCHPFISSLNISIKDLKEQLQEELSNSEDITETLNKLPTKPQDELFKRVFGCGERCPFCKVPCDAGGKEHKQHHAAVHRPQGLGRVIINGSRQLVERLCTTDVQSNCVFRNTRTKWEWHPYKDYTTYYPDWHIPPDPTIEASDYWKYVLVRYNDRFAKKYKAKPADVPEAWRSITKEQALKGLKDAFNIK